MKEAIPRLERRLQELEAVKIEHWDDQLKLQLDALQRKVEETLVDVFGADTIEYRRYEVIQFWRFVRSTYNSPPSLHQRAEGYERAITDAHLLPDPPASSPSASPTTLHPHRPAQSGL